ncbi:glycosyltransferase [Paenibacillus caui]|uniref:glycosyltransferase n=1 Tax=Paenibacillus caui TaxID=2873927 RepID=UPI001CA9AF00|nr:glycosyltransferase [Paenibacillus caui]
MNRLISVIVPVYNVENYLPKCLDSICGQTYSRLEIIIVNDGTKDGSERIIDEYALRDKRIKMVVKPNGGLSSARNAGMEIATGDYVAFIDSDDWIAPEMLEHMYDTAEAGNCDLVVCNYDKVFADHTERSFLQMKEEIVDVRKLGLAEYMYRYLFTYAHGHEVWNKLYRRDILVQNAIRFEPNKEIFSEDLLFNLYVLCHARNIAAIDRSFYFYLQREGSLMQAPSPQIGAQYVTLVERFKHYCDRLSRRQEIEPVLPVLLYDLMNACITQIYKSGGGRKMIGQALKTTSSADASQFGLYMRRLAFGRSMSIYRERTGGSLSSDIFGRFFAICCMFRLWNLFSGIKYKRLDGTAVRL